MASKYKAKFRREILRNYMENKNVYKYIHKTTKQLKQYPRREIHLKIYMKIDLLRRKLKV